MSAIHHPRRVCLGLSSDVIQLGTKHVMTQKQNYLIIHLNTQRFVSSCSLFTDGANIMKLSPGGPTRFVSVVCGRIVCVHLRTDV